MGLAKSEIILVSASSPKIPISPGDEPPYFTEKPEVEIQEIEKTVTFNCLAEGVPRPGGKFLTTSFAERS